MYCDKKVLKQRRINVASTSIRSWLSGYLKFQSETEPALSLTNASSYLCESMVYLKILNVRKSIRG